MLRNCRFSDSLIIKILKISFKGSKVWYNYLKCWWEMLKPWINWKIFLLPINTCRSCLSIIYFNMLSIIHFIMLGREFKRTLNMRLNGRLNGVFNRRLNSSRGLHIINCNVMRTNLTGWNRRSLNKSLTIRIGVGVLIIGFYNLLQVRCRLCHIIVKSYTRASWRRSIISLIVW